VSRFALKKKAEKCFFGGFEVNIKKKVRIESKGFFVGGDFIGINESQKENPREKKKMFYHHCKKKILEREEKKMFYHCRGAKLCPI
jgi:hypothetical protein